MTASTSSKSSAARPDVEAEAASFEDDRTPVEPFRVNDAERYRNEPDLPVPVGSLLRETVRMTTWKTGSRPKRVTGDVF